MNREAANNPFGDSNMKPDIEKLLMDLGGEKRYYEDGEPEYYIDLSFGEDIAIIYEVDTDICYLWTQESEKTFKDVDTIKRWIKFLSEELKQK